MNKFSDTGDICSINAGGIYNASTFATLAPRLYKRQHGSRTPALGIEIQKRKGRYAARQDTPISVNYNSYRHKSSSDCQLRTLYVYIGYPEMDVYIY